MDGLMEQETMRPTSIIRALQVGTVPSSMKAYLQITGSVQQKVRGLQVPVEHVRRMDVLEPPQDLVQEVANVIVT